MPIVKPELNLNGIKEYLDEQTLRKEKEFDYQGLWLFSGQQGAGKTLLMMHCVKKMIEEFQNARLISNISIFGLPCEPYKGIESFEVNNGKDGIIYVIDEIHTLFSSLESAKMPPSTLQVWSQNRKNRRVILGTSQRFNRVAKGIREQTAWVYECKRPLFGVFYSYYIKDGADFDENGEYRPEEQPARNWYVPHVKAMRMYNTFEIVRKEIKNESSH